MDSHNKMEEFSSKKNLFISMLKIEFTTKTKSLLIITPTCPEDLKFKEETSKIIYPTQATRL
jgi:hypothetical protein